MGTNFPKSQQKQEKQNMTMSNAFTNNIYSQNTGIHRKDVKKAVDLVKPRKNNSFDKDRNFYINNTLDRQNERIYQSNENANLVVEKSSRFLKETIDLRKNPNSNRKKVH